MTDQHTDNEFAIGDAWNKHKDFRIPFKYVLESSKQPLLIRRMEMPDLLKLGIANEMDFMTKALITSSADNKSPGDAVAEAVKLADNFGKMEIMINKVCVSGILKPQIYDVPPLESARQAGLFYVDQIPWDDRQELFGVIFDSEGLSDFRQEQESGVGDVADVQDVQLPANGFVADVQPIDAEGVLS